MIQVGRLHAAQNNSDAAIVALKQAILSLAKPPSGRLKYPPEVLVELKTCSTICGTHVHTILNNKDLTGLTVGVREGQNTEQ